MMSRNPGVSQPHLARRVLAAGLLGLWATLSCASADEPVTVTEGEAWQHLSSRVDPEWPENILATVHGSGMVLYTLIVAPDGRVTYVSPYASVLPEIDTTIEATLMQWTFQPFERDGHTVVATFHLTYPFAFNSVPAQADNSSVADRRSASLTDACQMRQRAAINAALWGQAKEICRQAVAAVERLPTTTHAAERCMAYRGMVAVLGEADVSAEAERDRAMAGQACADADRARAELLAARAHDPILGSWHWVADQILIIRPDGTFLVMQSGRQINSGQWEQLQPARYQFRHDLGGYIDTVTMSPDTASLAGMNNLGQQVAGHRAP